MLIYNLFLEDYKSTDQKQLIGTFKSLGALIDHIKGKEDFFQSIKLIFITDGMLAIEAMDRGINEAIKFYNVDIRELIE